MRLLQILGSGCGKCARLKTLADAAVDQLGIEATVEKIEDINAIAGFGVTMIPALVIDGKVEAAGRIPSVKEIKKMLT